MDNEVSRPAINRQTSQKRTLGNPQKFWRKVLITVLTLLFLWLCFSSVKIFLTYHEAKKNLIFAEHQKNQVENDIAELHIKLDQVKTGVGVEEHIRTKYPLIKEGERVLVISEDQTVKPAENKTFWQKVKEFF